MQFRSLLFVAQLMSIAVPAVSFVTVPTLASFSESSMRLAYSQQEDAAMSLDEETMNYIDNVVLFCQNMGYTLDEYDEMVTQLQDREELLRKRAKTIGRVLNMLEQQENNPGARHTPDAVEKLNLALDLVLEVEGLQEFASTKDLQVLQSSPKPHPPMSVPPKDLVQYSKGSNEYAKRRRHYRKVGIATKSDYTKQVKEYLKAVNANRQVSRMTFENFISFQGEPQHLWQGSNENI